MSASHKLRRPALFAIAALLFAAGLLVASATFTPFTVTEIMGPTIEQGTITVHDGNVHIRGKILDFTWAASDPRLSGTVRVVENLNIEKDMTGPMWGTSSSTIGNGTWDGVWAGHFDFAHFTGDYHATGIGGGDFKGLQFSVHCVYSGSPSAACTGRIVDARSR